MKRTINILYLSILVFASSFWGDVIAIFDDSSIMAATETLEKEEKKENEIKSYIETFEKIKSNGQGGKGFDEDTSSEYKSSSQAQAEFLATANPIILTDCIIYEKTILLKSYNQDLVNALNFCPFYILYSCPKSYLA